MLELNVGTQEFDGVDAPRGEWCVAIDFGTGILDFRPEPEPLVELEPRVEQSAQD